MTKYTKRRGYPYPSNAREVGNGGLHSELLARAIAADLDAVDAGWASELLHPTLLMTKNGDSTGHVNGVEYTITGFSTEKTVGTGLAANPILKALPGGAAWYHIVVTLRSKASGTITADAQHRVELVHYTTDVTGTLVQNDIRYSETFQTGTQDLYNELEAVMYIGVNDEVRIKFFHTNTGSTATVVGSGTGGTRIAATMIVRG